MASTPNMSLTQPVPGTAGPTWAEDINTNAGILDTHDHSAGKGVPVTPSGLNINTDLTVNSNKIIDLKSVKFVSQTSTLAGSGASDIYIKNGDLFYANGAVDVQITNGGSVAGVSGSIGGLTSPASATFASQQFSFFYDSGLYADLRCRDMVLSNGTTIKLTHSAIGSYTLTLPPSLPATNRQFLTISTTGAVQCLTNPTLGDASGVLTWQGTTETTAPGVGALVVAGGVAIGKRLRVENGAIIANGLTIVNAGLGITAGGASINGAVSVIGATSLTGTTTITGTTSMSSDLTVSGKINSGNVGLKTYKLSGILTNAGGLNFTHLLGSTIVSVQVFVLSDGTNWVCANYPTGLQGGLGNIGFNNTILYSTSSYAPYANLPFKAIAFVE